VVTASAAAASRLRGVACLNRVPAARGARLLCAAGGIVGTTDVKSAFELLQKGCVAHAKQGSVQGKEGLLVPRAPN